MDAKSPAGITPPRAPRRPLTSIQHGIARVDDYAWLRASNWQAVMRDPKALASDIRAELEAENAYTSDADGRHRGAAKQLFKEMKGRIKEDDSSVPDAGRDPLPTALFLKLGGEQPRYFRMPRDGGDRADPARRRRARPKARPISGIGGVDHSADRPQARAWAFDDKGSEFYTLASATLRGGEAPCATGFLDTTAARAYGTPAMTDSLLHAARRQPPPSQGLVPRAWHKPGTDRADL